MLNMVVFLAMASIVVRFLFLLPLVLVIPAGSMVLLYHLKLSTHYAQRGGRSTDSAGCGVFFVAGGSAFSHINWFFGAALLLYTLSFSWWCFFH
jgi:hypothetical protein